MRWRAAGAETEFKKSVGITDCEVMNFSFDFKFVDRAGTLTQTGRWELGALLLSEQLLDGVGFASGLLSSGLELRAS